jgi:hypothetical protein
MSTPRFVRFCRALALVGGPFVGVGAMCIPAVVDGCSSYDGSASGGGDTGTAPFDSEPTPRDTAVDAPADTILDAATDAASDADAVDASETGDGGPGEPPDLPFFSA